MSHEIFYMFCSLMEVTPKKSWIFKYCNVLLFPSFYFVNFFCVYRVCKLNKKVTAAFSKCFFPGVVIWKLEAVWVPKACFQVSLGYRPVAGFQGIFSNESMSIEDLDQYSFTAKSQHPSRTITSNMFPILKKCSRKFDCLVSQMFLIREHKRV